MVPEEDKIIICSLVAAGASLESAAAAYRLRGEDGMAEKCDRQAAKLKAEADRVLDGREL